MRGSSVVLHVQPAVHRVPAPGPSTSARAGVLEKNGCGPPGRSALGRRMQRAAVGRPVSGARDRPDASSAASTSSRRRRAAPGCSSGSNAVGACGSPASSAACAHRQAVGRPREVGLGRGLHPVGVVTVVGVVEVVLQVVRREWRCSSCVARHASWSLRDSVGAGARRYLSRASCGGSSSRPRRSSRPDVRDRRAGDPPQVERAGRVQKRASSIATVAFASHGDMRASGTGSRFRADGTAPRRAPSEAATNVLLPRARTCWDPRSHRTSAAGSFTNTPATAAQAPATTAVTSPKTR